MISWLVKSAQAGAGCAVYPRVLLPTTGRWVRGQLAKHPADQSGCYDHYASVSIQDATQPHSVLIPLQLSPHHD